MEIETSVGQWEEVLDSHLSLHKKMSAHELIHGVEEYKMLRNMIAYASRQDTS